MASPVRGGIRDAVLCCLIVVVGGQVPGQPSGIAGHGLHLPEHQYTDTGVGATQEDMMYGSNGANPPTRADEVRFFTQTWRYFETLDRQIESPTPIQGRWKIDGIGLPEAILRKIYFDNAVRLLHWRPSGT